jgi:hypothetical protein
MDAKLGSILILALALGAAGCGDDGSDGGSGGSAGSNGGSGGSAGGNGGSAGSNGGSAGSSGGSGGSAGMPVTGSALCTNQPPATAASCSTVTQWGITWTFDSDYPCGQFENGDYWVTPKAPGGKVKITAMDPAAAGGKNGFMVNPTANDAQAFDDGGPGYDASLMPALPYDASAGDSIVKAVSLASGCDKSCLQTAAVLSVLDGTPPQTAFRPAYFGGASDKLLYCSDSLALASLPSLSTTAAVDAEAPTLAGATDAIVRVQLDFFGSWAGEQIRPLDNTQESDPYGPEISNNNAEAVLRVLLQRPGDSDADRRAAVIALAQYGIDNDAIFRLGKAGWRADGGHGLGMKLPIALTGLVLNDQDMATRIQAAQRSDFAESDQVHMSAKGKVIWGQDRCKYQDATGEAEYWFDIENSPVTKTCLDPYLLIDGGAEPGGYYQGCCTSQALKGSALVVRLVPGLAPIWNDDLELDYADRWVGTGAATEPDYCAPPSQGGGPDPANPGHCIPDPDLTQCAAYPDCDCQAGKECGRFPALDGTGADQGLHGSAFVNVMWTAFR